MSGAAAAVRNVSGIGMLPRRGGSVCLVVVPGLADRVWTVAEVRSACAQAIPHARVLKRAAGIAVHTLPSAGAAGRGCAACVHEAPALLSGMPVAIEPDDPHGLGRASGDGGRLEAVLRLLSDTAAGHCPPRR